LFENPLLSDPAARLAEHETTPGQILEIAGLQQAISKMSPDEVQLLLRQMNRFTAIENM
jgi:hypothetical protein